MPHFPGVLRAHLRAHQRARRPLLVLLVAPLLTSGCRAAALAYGPDLASARTAFDDLAAAIEARFTNVVRAPKFANARLRIARFAFAPSKLVNDSALWTAQRTGPGGAQRDLELHAALTGNRYVFTARPGVPIPVGVGDERHLISLQRTGEDDWLWHTEVDHAVGTMPPSRTTDVFRALFASGERNAPVVRADYRAAFPRTAQAIGRLLRIDSVGTAAQADGSTIVTVRLLVSGDSVGRSFPAFGTYIRKYVEPARYRFRLAAAGVDWFDAQAANKVLTLRFRSHLGELQPLTGPARRLPDTLALHVDALAKIGLFTVGVTKMEGEFVHVSSARERAWAMRFTKEPRWHLPLIAERLLSTPLRRPFEGRGVVFRLGFRTGADGQTLLARTFDVAVRESAIMRFLGTLGFTAMSDFAGKVEEEENRFIAEAMRALRADMGALR